MSNLTRRSLVGALVGLAFAAAAGVGLAQITAGSTPSVATTSTTASQTTSTQTTTGDLEGQSADEQESADNDFESKPGDQTTSTALSTTSTAAALTTTGDTNAGTGQQKMDVCHKTGNGGQHTINIAAPAVPAHVAHGDSVGACLTTTATTAPTTTAAGTSTSTTTSTTSHGHKPNKQHGKSGHAAKNHAKGGKGHGK